MGDWTRFQNLDLGRTEKVEWAGKTLRLRVRPGRNGSTLELSPSPGSRVLTLFVLAFLAVHWSGFGGRALQYLVGSLHEEILEPSKILVAAVVAVLLNVIYVPFVALIVLDQTWSFESRVATQRLNLLGISLRARRHEVIDAIDGHDHLILRTADHRDVVVRASGWGSESDDETMPPDLSRLITAYLGVAPNSQMSTRMGTR